MTRQKAHDALADVLFWMKGFRAGLPNDESWRHQDADHNIEQLYAVQRYLDDSREKPA